MSLFCQQRKYLCNKKFNSSGWISMDKTGLEHLFFVYLYCFVCCFWGMCFPYQSRGQPHWQHYFCTSACVSKSYVPLEFEAWLWPQQLQDTKQKWTKLCFLCIFPLQPESSLSLWFIQTSGQASQGRAPLKVTMGRQRREQKVGLRGWIWAEVWDFLSLQSVELSGL